MTKFLLALLFAACTLAANAAENRDDPAWSRLWEQVQEGTAAPDHVARIGEFDYLVYIDYATSPITVLVKGTEESLDDLFDVKKVDRFDARLKAQNQLVKEYIANLKAANGQIPHEHQPLKGATSLTKTSTTALPEAACASPGALRSASLASGIRVVVRQSLSTEIDLTPAPNNREEGGREMKWLAPSQGRS